MGHFGAFWDIPPPNRSPAAKRAPVKLENGNIRCLSSWWTVATPSQARFRKTEGIRFLHLGHQIILRQVDLFHVVVQDLTLMHQQQGRIGDQLVQPFMTLSIDGPLSRKNPGR